MLTKTSNVICYHQGPISISDKTSYCKISQSLEATRFVFKIVWSLWNWIGTLAAVLPRCLSNLERLEKFKPESHSFETSRDLTIRCLIGYWNRAQTTMYLDTREESKRRNGTVTCHQQPRPLTCGVSSECLGTRSYETTSRDQRGKIEMFFSSTGACSTVKFPIANHHSQINTQLYSATLIWHIWQQRHSDSELDAL